MDRNTKTQEIIGSLGKILSELDEMKQDIVAIRIAEAICDLSEAETSGAPGQDIKDTGRSL